MRIYLDTSVIGGVLDKEFRAGSQRLVHEIERGVHTAVISDVTVGEIELAPKQIKEILFGIIETGHIERVVLTEEMVNLAERYLEQGIVSRKYEEDALHIAVATIAKVDVLVSWNFKHIVNLNRIHGFNKVNAEFKYPVLEIRSPLEVTDEEEI